MIAYAGWLRLRAGQSESLAMEPHARWSLDSLP
jgi:tRNA A37 threonylcarbamoyltransferase TsaD